jgi:exonuclease V
MIEDKRSPLMRFRSPPKKGLSVTDLVSPSWCELQYWFTLSKLGKKRQTPAMRQGSAVHKNLEEQVHRTVEVSTTTKEDAFALRILNAMQGLRTLRDTGMTRELELWGTVHGELVNGVVDELSYLCPDRDLEKQNPESVPKLKAGQLRLTDMVPHEPLGISSTRSMQAMQALSSKIYISDVKTRGHKSIPKGAAFRPTLYQLMLYHELLCQLADQKVAFGPIATRYNLDPDATFSDGFVAQVRQLDSKIDSQDSLPNATGLRPTTTSQDTLDTLLESTSLRRLWQKFMSELQKTMPKGSKSIGDVLKVEYRNRDDSSVLGVKTFLNDRMVLKSFIDSEMEWWRGERSAAGVCIEEAYKCRTCDFQEVCEWRLGKIEASTHNHRSRTRSNV